MLNFIFVCFEGFCFGFELFVLNFFLFFLFLFWIVFCDEDWEINFVGFNKSWLLEEFFFVFKFIGVSDGFLLFIVIVDILLFRVLFYEFKEVIFLDIWWE